MNRDAMVIKEVQPTPAQARSGCAGRRAGQRQARRCHIPFPTRISVGAFLGAALLLASACGLRAQGVIAQGLEQRAHAPLPGDQVFPAAAFNGDRGIIVWEDNFIDAHRRWTEFGTGIAACLVEGQNLQPLSGPFRVHWYRWGDQRRPQVALLPDGEALFAYEGNQRWRRRKPGQADAFVRFMNHRGRAVGREISLTPRQTRDRNIRIVERPSWRLNRLRHRRWRLPERIYYGRSQTSSPIPVVLADGQPAVLYSQVRKAETNTFRIMTEISTRMWRGKIFFRTNDVLERVTYTHQSGHDIYLQKLDARRKRAEGPEIQVNQFVDHNQRHPDAALLADGRIVVVWVSEDEVAQLPSQRSRVVIRGRLLSPQGDPLGSDFIINSDDAICARPTVAAAGDGGFAVAWNQRDTNPDNSWDIHARVYGADAMAEVEAFEVNQHTYGDQYAPSLGATDASYLLAWVSLNQDGSRGGIVARQLSAGGPAGVEFIVNNTTENQQIQPVVASAGGDEAMVLWSAYSGADGFEILRRSYRLVPPLPAPEPPSVDPEGETRLQVSWDAVDIVGLQHYELHVDDQAAPVVTTATQHELGNLAPGSTHQFRLAYVLADGRRSLLSRAVTGTTEGESAGGSGQDATVSGPGSGEQDGTATGGSALTVGIRRVEEGVELAWNTEPGEAYQVQVSGDFVRWIDFGGVIVAEGDRETLVVKTKEVTMLFRVVETSPQP